MSIEERDRYTGHLTTGHSWNGIKELNSRVPRLWYICFSIMFIFSVGYWVYMPAWPLVRSYTQGLLTFDQRDELDRQVSEALIRTNDWREPLSTLSLDDIANDDDLMAIVSRTGPALFEDNCAGCHGRSGEGAKNYPRLNDSVWLWRAEPSSIYQTLKYGINSGHAESRIAQMPAFGATGVLSAKQIEDVSLYVLSLSLTAIGDGSRVPELLSVNQGRKLYETYCIACHGQDAKGNQLLGAANLVDQEWMYGFSTNEIMQTIDQGRAGHMPAWIDRLDDTELRLLSAYVPLLSTNKLPAVGDGDKP